MRLALPNVLRRERSEPEEDTMAMAQNTNAKNVSIEDERSFMYRPVTVIAEDGTRRQLFKAKSSFHITAAHPYVDVVHTMQWLGFFPRSIKQRFIGINGDQCPVLCPKTVSSGVFSLLTLGFLAVNVAFFALNVKVTHQLRESLTLMHAYTMTSIITGMVPMQNAINMILFWFGLGSHHRLLKEVQRRVNECFPLPEHRRFIFHLRRKLYSILIAVALIPLLARIIQCIIQPLLLQRWHGPVSLVIVPILRVWQVIPLLYFDLICSTATKMFKQIGRTVLADPTYQHTSAETLLKRFYGAAMMCRRLSTFISPFIFVSILLAVLNLCITVFFIINAKDFGTFPRDGHWRTEANTYFDLGWGVLQVVIACAYAVIICRSGWTTNTQARRAISRVLQSEPQSEDERFVVLKIQKMMATQQDWGVTLWRAFAIERSFFFTISSSILGYSWLLLRMKPAETTTTYADMLYCLGSYANRTQLCNCFGNYKEDVGICY